MTDTLRTARAAYLDARAAEYAADLALAEAVRDHVRAAVPAASWQAATHSVPQTYALTRHDAPGPTVWVTMAVDRMDVVWWMASLEWADWTTLAVTSGAPLPDPAAALRALLDAVRAKARRVRRPDRRAELGVAATALAGWLEAA